jgi:hypothetical protein
MRINLIIITLFVNMFCSGSPNLSTEEIIIQQTDFLSSQPKEQRKKDYEEGLQYIQNCLSNKVSAGYATYGSTSALAKSLGIEKDFEDHIERWFSEHANVDHNITDLIYEFKEPKEWIELFKQEYPKLTNPKVLYRMRFYSFSENFAFPQTNSSCPESKEKGLEIKLVPENSEHYSVFKLTITNTSKYDVFVFPQTEKVATLWYREDGVPLPNRTSSKYDAEKSTGLFFIFPGDSLHRKLSLQPVVRNKTFYKPSDVIFLKNKHEFTCINGVYLTKDNEAPLIEMRAYLVPFSSTQGKVLQSDLQSKYGHKSSRIHVVQEPLFSNPIKLVVQQGTITDLKLE